MAVQKGRGVDHQGGQSPAQESQRECPPPFQNTTLKIVLTNIPVYLSKVPMVEKVESNDTKNSVVFSLKDQVGGLARALQVFQVSDICLIHPAVFENL